MPIIVDIDKCTGCETCLESCPFDAINMKGDKAVINEYCNSCMTCISVCPESAIIETEPAEQSTEHGQKLEDYKDVLVFAEQREGRVASVALELLGAGRRLADELDAKLLAVLLGAGESEAQELIKWGADTVLVCRLRRLEGHLYREWRQG
jgi:electron transfer flavoprotein alpha subunit